MEGTLQELKKFYELPVLEYCKYRNLKLTKVKCGAVQLDKCTDVMECAKILQNIIEEPLFSNHYAMLCGIPKLPPKVQILPLEQKLYEEDNPYLININIKVTLKEKSNYISLRHTSNNCILDRALSVREIYDNMIKTRVNKFDTPEIDPRTLDHLIPILKEFQKNHKKYLYKEHLDKFLNKNNIGEFRNSGKQSSNKIDDIEINVKKMNNFFYHMLRRVVPIKLFGTVTNLRIITKLIYGILNSARFQPIFLKNYISRLNIEKIEWLEFIKDKSVKWIVISKLIIWFLTKYLYYIINRLFFWTVHPAAIGKRLFIKSGKWKVIKKNFVRDKIRSYVLIDTYENNLISPKCEFKLFLKYSGIRPIAKTSYSAKEKTHMMMLLKFLSQLCIKEYGIATMSEFHNKFKTIARERHNSGSEYKKTWLVSCDINDAFGSIRLDKLNNIIKILCKDLPDVLFLKWVICVPIKSRTGDARYEQYFAALPVALPVGTIFSLSNIEKIGNHPTYMMKKQLLNDIRKCIFGQKVTIKEKEYIVAKGILQGTILSNVFSNIYYNYVYHQKLSEFMNSGLLFRYVDDTLYLSENRESAEKFLKIISEGFPEYNCSFKRSKIQTNLPDQKVPTTNEINFLGYSINCNSLESLPYFKNAHPSYLFSLAMRNKIGKSAVLMFKERIINCSYLRLSKIILHNPNTSERRLIHFIRKISIMQAWRAFTYISKLFGNLRTLYRDYQEIFLIIKESNEKIVLTFLRYYTEDIANKSDFDANEIKNKIFMFLWSGYRHVFSNNKVMQNLFGKGIREEINKHKKILNILKYKQITRIRYCQVTFQEYSVKFS
ncbi:telomerase reverse transcriptase-like [Polistes fuscatus]|uniref:telomerase reverse transcriptase-like n=1 Tax=Polistes fuscatus TaxID=30207 RepID=UPI001CA8FA16|nr:telomerase reverse transcriptase-like [Polistes fuscatus]